MSSSSPVRESPQRIACPKVGKGWTCLVTEEPSGRRRTSCWFSPVREVRKRRVGRYELTSITGGTRYFRLYQARRRERRIREEAGDIPSDLGRWLSTRK